MKDKLLRIKLHQNKANYKKEETSENKMTYPLPPYSTIIGAIHNACNCKEYNDMDISIQGRFQSLGKEMYRDQAFLNNVMDDRGILVKLKNPDTFNEGYKIIAKALKPQENSFKNRTTIDIYDEEELQEYIRICNLREFYQKKSDDFKIFEKSVKDEISKLKIRQKQFDKKSEEYKNLLSEINDLNSKIKLEKLKFAEEKNTKCTIPYSYYASLTTSIKYYEVLYDVDLVVHIRSSKEVLDTVEKNIINFTSLGRSEDFVEIKEVKFVDIYEDNPNDIEFIYNSGYVYTEAIEKGIVTFKSIRKKVNKIKTKGTNYFINKNYKIEKGKRIFKKYRVGYLSEYKINFDELKEYNKSTDKNIYLDEDGYIVSLV